MREREVSEVDLVMISGRGLGRVSFSKAHLTYGLGSGKA